MIRIGSWRRDGLAPVILQAMVTAGPGWDGPSDIALAAWLPLVVAAAGMKDSVLSRWKQEFIERSPKLFEQGSTSDDSDQRIAELERMIGRLTLDLDMAKKVSRYLNSNRNGSESGGHAV